MKRFKNSFGVKGSLPLLMALKKEVEKLGWKYDNNFSSGHSEDHPDLYFNAHRPKDAMKINHFSFSNVYNCTIYNLPQQWDECLKAASELEEETPEYVKLLSDNYGFKKDDIAKVIAKDNTGYIVFVPNRYSYSACRPNVWYYISCTEPSTKEAYKKQQEKVKMQELLKEIEPWTIGTYVVFLKEYGGNSKGTISSIVRTGERTIETEASMFLTGKTCCLFKDEECEWFPTLQEAEAFSKKLLKVEPIEIAGYNVKFKENKVSIGCYKDINLKDLKTMRKAIKVASKFGKDLTVTEDSIIDNTENSAIFLDEIEELIERLNG